MFYNIPQNCLSLTANTILVDQHPIQSHQNVVSPDDTTRHITDAHCNTTQNCLSLTANTNQGVFQLDQNVVSLNYNTIHISDTTQNCLSLTANTILVDQHPIQSHQNVVSPNYNTIHISDTTQNCLSLIANTILVDQHPIQFDQNVVSLDDITGFVSV